MTLLEAETIFAYWAEHPPAHLAVAAGLGLGPGRPCEKSPLGADPFSSIAAVPGIEEGAVDRGLEAPALDFSELKRRRQRKD